MTTEERAFRSLVSWLQEYRPEAYYEARRSFQLKFERGSASRARDLINERIVQRLSQPVEAP